MGKITELLKPKKKDKKLISKLNHTYFYLGVLWVSYFLFKPTKKFLVFRKKSSKKGTGIISYSIFRLFRYKIGYIDDFVVNKKLRGKGVGNNIFQHAVEKTKSEEVDYTTLLTKQDTTRKGAQKLYKKAGFTLLYCGLFVFGYKKMKKEK